jgi:hypothetical protein
MCVVCSGRFGLRDGKIVEHESAPEDERESIASKDETSVHGGRPGSSRERKV